jgi:hypothetical protein
VSHFYFDSSALVKRYSVTKLHRVEGNAAHLLDTARIGFLLIPLFHNFVSS